jgi:excisionase family DNA binding protein
LITQTTVIDSAADAKPSSVMLTVDQVAAMLNCSSRHVYRLCDIKRMPPPVRLGMLVRWNRNVIDKWINAGCPPVRAQTRRR